MRDLSLFFPPSTFIFSCLILLLACVITETLLTPDKFAEIICSDNKIHPRFAPLIAASIKQQIREFIPHVPTDEAEELRIIIKLDITVGEICLIDQFEWDINCPKNSPEQFAEVMAAELGLSNEFKSEFTFLFLFFFFSLFLFFPSFSLLSFF